jgi:hypothetical protein
MNNRGILQFLRGILAAVELHSVKARYDGPTNNKRIQNRKNPTMKIKLTLLAAVIIAAVASSAAIAGRDKPATPNMKPAGMSCCAAAPKAATPAPVSEKDAPAQKGMRCHSAAPVAKGCCK